MYFNTFFQVALKKLQYSVAKVVRDLSREETNKLRRNSMLAEITAMISLYANGEEEVRQ